MAGRVYHAPLIAAVPGSCQHAFYATVAEALDGNGDGPNTASQALMVQAVIDAAHRSARDGQVVAL